MPTARWRTCARAPTSTVRASACKGWPNGGSATLAAMAAGSGLVPVSQQGFRAALAFYPARGLKDAFNDSGYKPYAPVAVFMGEADEEVSPRRCAAFVAASRAAGGDISIRLYPGAEHGFDDPGESASASTPMRDATEDRLARAVTFFARALAR